MAGIAAAGVYIPAGRLSGAVMAKAWGLPAVPGERAVAGADEDSLTMAAEAARRALVAGGIEPAAVSALYLATTTAVYTEKLGSAIVAAALDLGDSAVTLDVGGSLRCGLGALRAGVERVRAEGGVVLVVASDRRVLAPGSTAEQRSGDGAVALVVTPEGALARLDAWGTVHDDLTARWRSALDQVVREFEPRLEIGPGNLQVLAEACQQALDAAGITPAMVAALVLGGLAERAGLVAMDRIGVPRDATVPSLADQVGDTGAAAPLLALVAALERTQEGDPLLVAAWADGADAAVMTRGAGICAVVETALARRRPIASYETYATARGLVATHDHDHDLEVSPVAYWRRRKAILGRYGMVCRSCGTVQYPPAPTCTGCGSSASLEPRRLADRGEIYTFTNDHLVGGRYVEAGVPRCVVELDGGGRYYTTMTDCDPAAIRIGMRVELTLRSRGTGGGFSNYGWKCLPEGG